MFEVSVDSCCEQHSHQYFLLNSFVLLNVTALFYSTFKLSGNSHAIITNINKIQQRNGKAKTQFEGIRAVLRHRDHCVSNSSNEGNRNRQTTNFWNRVDEPPILRLGASTRTRTFWRRKDFFQGGIVDFSRGSRKNFQGGNKSGVLSF